MTLVRIGTRGSRLSLWQARRIAALVQAAHPRARVEIRRVQTRGDRDQSSPLAAIGGAGVFTGALEAALLRGEIDCAVHSLKDLPVAATPGLCVAAVPKRGDHRDALVSRSGARLDLLPPGARIGTGSPRRRAQSLALRPDLVVLPIRGNVPTRLEKLMHSDEYDALVLAAAGLERLELSRHISEIFADERLLCAPGQGAIAVQCRDEATWLDFFAPLDEPACANATRAERAFLKALAGGCSLPIAARAWVSDGRLRLIGRVTALDGTSQIDVHSQAIATDAQSATALGERLAARALQHGARKLLDDAEAAQTTEDSP